MTAATSESAALRAAITERREAMQEILVRYRATNPRLFGSVARGEAGPRSDLDVIVDLLPDGGNPLLRVAGIAEELSVLLGHRVDVVADSLLKEGVSKTAAEDAVPV